MKKISTNNLGYIFSITGFLLFSLTSCSEKENPQIQTPILTTEAVAIISHSTAKSGGNISDDGGSPIVTRGVCWGTGHNPTTANGISNDGTGVGSYTSYLNNLLSNTKYYVRAYAINGVGISYGNELSFTTKTSVTDIDGNSYGVVQIGSQFWMTENLKTTKLNNGTAILNIINDDEWETNSNPAYSWYNNNEDYYSTSYGALYNWYTVNTGILCPTGWHIPNESDWTTLSNYLGGLSVAGGKLKEAGTTHWNEPNTDATNESGFSAVPGGSRWGTNGIFEFNGINGYYWTTDEVDATMAFLFILKNNSSIAIYGPGSKRNGLSVRCLKD